MPPRTTRAWLLAAITLTLSALALSGCRTSDIGDDQKADASAVLGQDVAIVDNAFEPRHLRVSAGATVTWHWEGENPHDVAGDGFKSDVQTSGSFSRTFDRAGRFDYACTVHPEMRGVLTVDPA